MKFLRIADVGDLARANVIAAAHLDSPLAGTVYGSESVKAMISGWVLAKDDGCPSIKVRDVSRQVVTIPLSINRPDVRRRILNDGSNAPLLCGFRGQVDLSAASEILIELNGQDYAWKTIELEPVDSLWLTETKSIWQSFLSARTVSHGDAVRLASIDPSVVDALLIGAVKSCHDVKSFLSASGLSASQAGGVEAFFRTLANPDLSRDLVSGALTNGAASLVNPFSGHAALCAFSWLASNSINCLLFRDADEVFFVFQHVTSADAVYFPLRNLVVLRHHITVQEVLGCVHQLFRSAPQAFAQPEVKKTFGGVIASHGRPYHFYYDVAPAVESLHEAGLLEKLPALFMLEGGDYFSLKSLYGFEADERVVSASELNKENISRNRFLILLGIQFGEGTKALVETFDARVNSTLPDLLSADLKRECEQARQCFPLIWFGVIGQKRSWNEQVEAAVKLVNSIHIAFPGMGICFDGWTSALTPTSRDEVESARDVLIVKEILERIPETVPIFNLVGANSVHKIAFAQVVDFFVANYATGSMHVARFAKKPGLGHISNSMNCDGHIHYQTRRVPSEDVMDVVSTEKLRPDFVSYSIAPEVVWKLVSELMRDEPLIDNRMSLHI